MTITTHLAVFYATNSKVLRRKVIPDHSAQLAQCALNRVKAYCCCRSPVPMTTQPAELLSLKPRVARHRADDAASSTNQARWWLYAMPIPHWTSTRGVVSLPMTPRCPVTVILMKCSYVDLSDAHFGHHSLISENLAPYCRSQQPDPTSRLLRGPDMTQIYIISGTS